MIISKTPGKPLITVTLLAVLLTACGQSEGPPPAPDSSDASSYTIAANNEFTKYLDLANRQDFEDASKGLIAKAPDVPIKDNSGAVIWDASNYNYIPPVKAQYAQRAVQG
jgi:alkyl sulfatase BDS1-like metallo-beta-lactamase superfamily hydrolase